jgi:1-acyl-sn-glycerol-3-phosphate acyltransferase
MLYLLLYLGLRIYVRLLCRVRASGREHIPERGPFIVITNHLSSVDPPVLLSLIPSRLRMTGLAASVHRHDPFIGWAMNKGGAVWVRRGEGDRDALRQSLEVLSSGRPLGVSPEGTRSKTGALIEAKTGVAFLALRASVPILPVALTDTQKVFSSWRRLRRPTVHARIGPAFALPPRGEGPRREHLQYCTDLIMARLASMLPEEYRGFYAGHPLIAYWQGLDASDMASRPEWKPDPVQSH